MSREFGLLFESLSNDVLDLLNVYGTGGVAHALNLSNVFETENIPMYV